MSFSARSRASLLLLVFIAPTAAYAQGFDVTRVWTMCTTGDANACAELSLRTASLSTGGTHVSVGLSNLQGTSLFDNMTSSLLYRAFFRYGTDLGFTTRYDIGGRAEDGAVAPTRDWEVWDDPGSIVLNAGGASVEHTSTFVATVTNQVYRGTGTHYGDGWYSDFESRSWSEDLFSHNYSHVDPGLAGVNADPRHTVSSDPQTISYRSDQLDVRCRSSVLGSCLEWEYRPRTLTSTDGTYVPLVREHYFSPDGQTAGGTVWFEFESAFAHDARLVERVTFATHGLNDVRGDDHCYSTSPLACTVVSDVTYDNRVTVTPEPVSLLLLGSGLFAIAGAARRRRLFGPIA